MQLRAGSTTRTTLVVLVACQVAMLVAAGLCHDLPAVEGGGTGPPALLSIAALVNSYWCVRAIRKSWAFPLLWSAVLLLVVPWSSFWGDVSIQREVYARAALVKMGGTPGEFPVERWRLGLQLARGCGLIELVVLGVLWARRAA